MTKLQRCCAPAACSAAAPRFSRPHSFVYSEHQPKECAGSRKEKERKETKKNRKKLKERRLVRYRAERARAKGKGEGCHSHAPTLNEHSPSAFPLQAGGSADNIIHFGRVLVAVFGHHPAGSWSMSIFFTDSNLTGL